MYLQFNGDDNEQTILEKSWCGQEHVISLQIKILWTTYYMDIVGVLRFEIQVQATSRPYKSHRGLFFYE